MVSTPDFSHPNPLAGYGASLCPVSSELVLSPLRPHVYLTLSCHSERRFPHWTGRLLWEGIGCLILANVLAVSTSESYGVSH